MNFALIMNGVATEVGGAAFADASGIKHARAVLDLWSAEDLAAIGVHAIDEPALGPGQTYAEGLILVDGVPTRQVASESLAEAQAWARAELARQRWQATQAFTFDGVLTQADEAMPVLTGMVVAAQASLLPMPVNYKLGEGAWRTYDLAAVMALGQAVGAHIQACFDAERAASEAVAAAATPEAVRTAVAAVSWPQ